MGLAGVRIMSAKRPEPVAELRLAGGRAVAVSGGNQVGLSDMLANGVAFRAGDLSSVARIARKHRVKVPDLDRSVVPRSTPPLGVLFLLGGGARFAPPTGYSWAEAVQG